MKSDASSLTYNMVSHVNYLLVHISPCRVSSKFSNANVNLVDNLELTLRGTNMYQYVINVLKVRLTVLLVKGKSEKYRVVQLYWDK